MGAFDTPSDVPRLDSKYPEGTSIKVDSIKMGMKFTSVHGPAQQVLVAVNGEYLSVIGQGFEQQVLNQSPGDFPSWVKIQRFPTSAGNEVKRFVPAEPPAGSATAPVAS